MKEPVRILFLQGERLEIAGQLVEDEGFVRTELLDHMDEGSVKLRGPEGAQRLRATLASTS